MTGRHRAAPGAVTEPMRAICTGTPPRDPAPETTSMPAITPDDVAAYDRARKLADDPDAWLEPFRTGGTRVERRMRQTMKDRGLLLPKRVSAFARRVRAAIAKGGRR